MTQPTYLNGLLFTKAHKLVRARVYSLLGTYDLNPTCWSILSSIVQTDGGIRPAKVAALLAVKPPLVTMISNDLIDRDLVQRIAHHTDKRAKLLIATNKGRKLAISIELELNREIAQLLHGLSRQETRTFQKTLETIIANASDE